MSNVGGWWADWKKVEVVKAFLITGSVADASRVCGVPYDTVRHWRMTDWWQEIEDNLRSEDNMVLSAGLKKRIDKAMALADDRMDNGDFFFNKEGEVVRKPVGLRDVNKTLEVYIKAKSDVDQAPKQAQTMQGVQDALAKISEQFSKLTLRQRKVEAVDAIEVTSSTSVDESQQTSNVPALGSGNTEGQETTQKGG